MYIESKYTEPLLFEYDPNKSNSNLTKHGIDFEQAKLLWDDERKVVLEACTEPELRYFVIGKIFNKYWTAFFTPRNDAIRLISVRRSRKQEISYYEKHH